MHVACLTSWLVDDAMRGDRLLALVAQRSVEVEQAGPNDVYRVGTAGIIQQFVRANDGTLRMLVQGVERVRLLDVTSTQPYLQAALTFLRSDARRLGIDPSVFHRKTIHVHVPAGAIPKDGPSAGVAMLAALASVATGRPVRGDIAMTGEITLRGKVLPVGGIKEKVLAAHRAGVKAVILPRRNERDLEDVPQELQRELEFVFVDTADDVLAHVFEPAAAAVVATPARMAA